MLLVGSKLTVLVNGTVDTFGSSRGLDEGRLNEKPDIAAAGIGFWDSVVVANLLSVVVD